MHIEEAAVPSRKYLESLELRNELLRIPLGLDIFEEDLEVEKEQIHFVMLEADKVEGVVILVPNIEPGKGKLRQMAIAERHQGKGYGSKLVQHLEHKARDLGMNRIRLHARDLAVPFYEKLGYQVVSEIFTEVGILHVAMEKFIGHQN